MTDQLVEIEPIGGDMTGGVLNDWWRCSRLVCVSLSVPVCVCVRRRTRIKQRAHTPGIATDPQSTQAPPSQVCAAYFLGLSATIKRSICSCQCDN